MPPEPQGATPGRRKVLLIGWDAADWQIIHPLVATGKMPHLARFLQEGVSGSLATIQPALSPMLWTSIATGKRPFKHGIHGFTELDPLSGGVRPVTSLSRRCRALWNMLQLHGLRSLVVGWWPSHPAEPIDGCMVSNQFQLTTAAVDQDWPVPPGAVHPPHLANTLANLRIHPHQLDASHLLPFVPRAAEIDQASDIRLQAIARILAECTTLHGVTTGLMQNEEWDFAAVYLDAIDHFCHGFMKFHPPHRADVPERDFELYHGVVEAAYRYHDMMLGTLLQLAGEDATVLLVSDHGFQSGSQLPTALPIEPAGPASEHRRFGIFAARGPGIPAGRKVMGAGILDICPSILALFGLPVGQDMDGKIIPELAEAAPPVRSIPSWEALEGEDGSHPVGTTASPTDTRAAIEQLVALGYISPPDADASAEAEKTTRELSYNLAQSYMDCGRYADARPLLERLRQEWPGEPRFGVRLAACHHAIGHPAEVKRLVRELVRDRLRDARRVRREPDPQNPARRETRAYVDRDALRHFMAFGDFSAGDYRRALARLRATSPAYRSRPDARNTEADMLLRLREWNEAEAIFREVLEIDPDNPSAWKGIARARLGRRDFEAAIEAATESLRLVFEQPLVHFLLGMACYRASHIDRAEQAFLVTIRMNSSHAPAYRMLSEIQLRHRGDSGLSASFSSLAHAARQKLRSLEKQRVEPAAPAPLPSTPNFDFPIETEAPPEQIITVVSGLPRSGTSMMMQMLAAAGVPVFTDHARAADASNPHGYLEHRATLDLSKDNRWLPEARGHAVKIVAPLLPFLPVRDAHGEPIHYRVILMRRPVDQVIDSQRRMLGGRDPDTLALSRAFHDQLLSAHAFLKRHRLPTLEIDYAATCAAPDVTAARVAAFLGGKQPHLSAMAETVRPA